MCIPDQCPDRLRCWRHVLCPHWSFEVRCPQADLAAGCFENPGANLRGNNGQKGRDIVGNYFHRILVKSCLNCPSGEKSFANMRQQMGPQMRSPFHSRLRHATPSGWGLLDTLPAQVAQDCVWDPLWFAGALVNPKGKVWKGPFRPLLSHSHTQAK